MQNKIIQDSTHFLLGKDNRILTTKVIFATIYLIIFSILFIPDAEYPLITCLTLVPSLIAFWFGPISLLSISQSRIKWYDPAILFNSATFYYVIKGVTLGRGEKPIYLEGLSFETILNNYAEVSIYLTVGILAWNFGYRRAYQKKSHLISKFHNNTKIVCTATKSILFLSIVGLICFLLFFYSIGADLFLFIKNPLYRSYLSDGTFGISSPFANLWALGINMFPAATLLWIATIGNQKQKSKHLWIIHALVALGMYLLSGSGRGIVISFALSVLLVYHLMVRPISRAKLVTFAAIVLVYSYVIDEWRSLSDVLRENVVGGDSGLFNNLNLDGLYSFLSSTSLSDIRVFVLVSETYGRLIPLKFGTTLLWTVLQYVPRAFWPGKPLEIGIELKALYSPDTITGIPPGFFAEMFMNFHLPGVIFGCFFLGLGLGLFYRRMIGPRMNPLSVVLYAILMPKILFLPSTTFGSLVGNTFIVMVVVSIVYKVLNPVRLRNRSSG